MRSKYVTVAIVIAMALPGVLSVLPSTQGLPEGPGAGGGLLAAEAGAGAELSGPSMLHMVVAEFDPLEDAVDLPRELRTRKWDGLFLVQFTGPLLPTWEERVERAGCHFLSYIPENAFVTRMTRTARLAVVDMPFVRWVGPFHPGYRVDPALWADPRPVLGLAVASLDDPSSTAWAFEQLGGALEVVGTSTVQGFLPRVSLPLLAGHSSVGWVERWLEPELHNDKSARLIGSRQQADGPYDNGTLRMWSFNSGVFEGTTGAGYVVSAADTGLDGTHGNFPGKLASKNYHGGNPDRDTYGHGTHVLGTAAGVGLPYPADASAATYKYIGVAPEARVFSQDIFEGFSFYRHFDELGKDASVMGAVSNSNSWGEMRGGQYTTNEQAYDKMVRDADPGKPGDQPIVFCFSAGNSGPGSSSMASPASGKNMITVGATGNDKGLSAGSVAGFSSRGPTADDRVKPDVVASGVEVTSSAARQPTTMPFRPPADGGYSWTAASGTSMSCPAVAGAVAIVHDWSNTNWGHDPSPALVKGLMINGADKLSGSEYPDNRQGWGRVNLTKLHPGNDYRTFFYDQDTPLRVGGNREAERYIFAVEDGRRTVKITLVWTDYPGTPGASKHLVSDLDLMVTDPDGNVYKGNNFDGSGHSLIGTERLNDTVNNVEKIVLPRAEPGFWSVRVMARNTPRGAQDYALVVQGDVQDKWRDLAALNVTLNKEELDEGEPVVFSGDIVAMGNLPIAPFHYEVYLLNTDTGGKTIFEEDNVSLGAWESISFFHRWFAVRGNWEFAVDVDTAGANREFSKDNNFFNATRFVKGYGLKAELIPDKLTVWPGLETHMEVNILNTGNVRDTYVLSTEGIPVGWEVSLTKDDIRLGVDRTGTITLKAKPPAAAKAGEVYSLNVKVTSQGNSTYTSDMGTEASVGHVHGHSSDLARQGSNVFPGRSVEHKVNITNTGNGMDTFNLEVYGLPEGWRTDLGEGNFSLEDNVTKTVSLEVESPEDALSGTIAELEIVVTSTTGKSSIVRARTQVKQTTGMSATMEAETTVRPGGTIEYTVDIHNLGNGPDIFWYSDEAPNGAWSTTFPFPRDGMALKAFESISVTGELHCPPNARSGIYTFMVDVSTREFLEELEVDVTVEEVYDASPVLLCTGSAIYPGNDTSYCLEVTSLCNLPTEFTMSLEGAPSDWQLQQDPGTATIDPLQERTFHVVVMPPDSTPSGFYPLKIVLEYGPRAESFNKTLYILERPSTVEPGPGDGDASLSLSPTVLAVLVAVIVLVVVILVMLTRRGGPRPQGVEYIEEVEPGVRSRPLPPPPPPDSAPHRRPPPPPPPKAPETAGELLSDTGAISRVSASYDRYSADVQYATGRTIAEADQPHYAGDCPNCGAKVMEYPSGALMCESCGAQFTEE